MTQEVLTRERLLELFAYDPQTGVFTRRKDVIAGNGGVRAKAGSLAGSKTAEGYISIWVNGRAYLAHRLAWLYMHGVWPSAEIDHVNGVKGDNRLCNLREATHAENCRNRLNSRSGLKGVRHRRGKWEARITSNGKTFQIGTFKTAEEAHAAYVAAAQKNHGQFARVA